MARFGVVELLKLRQKSLFAVKVRNLCLVKSVYIQHLKTDNRFVWEESVFGWCYPLYPLPETKSLLLNGVRIGGYIGNKPNMWPWPVYATSAEWLKYIYRYEPQQFMSLVPDNLLKGIMTRNPVEWFWERIMSRDDPVLRKKVTEAYMRYKNTVG